MQVCRWFLIFHKLCFRFFFVHIGRTRSHEISNADYSNGEFCESHAHALHHQTLTWWPAYATLIQFYNKNWHIWTESAQLHFTSNQNSMLRVSARSKQARKPGTGSLIVLISSVCVPCTFSECSTNVFYLAHLLNGCWHISALSSTAGTAIDGLSVGVIEIRAGTTGNLTLWCRETIAEMGSSPTFWWSCSVSYLFVRRP